MERRTRDARPALRSLFGPASFGPAGVIEPRRQNRSRSGHADQRLWLRRGSCRSRWAPRDRRNNHQDDDRRPTLSRFLPRHVPFPLAAYLHVSGVGPSRALCVGRKRVASPFRGRERRDSLDRGMNLVHGTQSNAGWPQFVRKKGGLAASQKAQHLPWQSPGDRPQATGASFFFVGGRGPGRLPGDGS